MFVLWIYLENVLLSSFYSFFIFYVFLLFTNGFPLFLFFFFWYYCCICHSIILCLMCVRQRGIFHMLYSIFSAWFSIYYVGNFTTFLLTMIGLFIATWVHRHPGPYDWYSGWLLANDLGTEVWSHRHAVRPAGKRTSKTINSYILQLSRCMLGANISFKNLQLSLFFLSALAAWSVSRITHLSIELNFKLLLTSYNNAILSFLINCFNNPK